MPRMSRYRTTVVLGLSLLAAAQLGACRKRERPKRPMAPPDAGAPARSVLDPAFPFRCSSERSVGCSGVFPVRGGAQPSEAAILWGGEEAFRARVDSLRRARRSVRVQALIFRGDDAGLHIAELLKQKKKEGLDVRVIVDAMSNLEWQTQWMYFDLKRHGVQVEGYEALYLQWVTAEVKPADPLRPNKRFHDKMWVIDAEDPERRLAIVGGLNIANEYFRVDPDPLNKWHDQDVVLRGPIVDDVARAFDRNYTFCKSLKRRLSSGANPDNLWRLARGVLGKIRRVKVPFWRSKAIGEQIQRMLARPPELSFRAARARFVQSRPRMAESYIEQAYLAMIARAKRRILIANAYFIPSRRMSDALRAAARRGVRVVILTNSAETNDIRSVALVSRHTYLDLLKVNLDRKMRRPAGARAGLEIYEWVGLPFSEGTLHAKYAVFDSESLIVGSFNLDPRSARLNSETAVVLEDRELAGRMARELLERDLPRAKRITLGEARRFQRPEQLAKQFELLFALPIKDWL
jgi:putative cardiolipin synthase